MRLTARWLKCKAKWCHGPKCYRLPVTFRAIGKSDKKLPATFCPIVGPDKKLPATRSVVGRKVTGNFLSLWAGNFLSQPGNFLSQIKFSMDFHSPLTQSRTSVLVPRQMETREYLTRIFVLTHNVAKDGPFEPRPWFPPQYLPGGEPKVPRREPTAKSGTNPKPKPKEPKGPRTAEQIKAARGMFYKRTRENYKLENDDDGKVCGLLTREWEEKLKAGEDQGDGSGSSPPIWPCLRYALGVKSLSLK